MTTEKCPVMTLTPGRMRALLGVQECAGQDGWATRWPADIRDAKLKECKAAGWLEYTTIRITSASTIGFGAYRLTPAGEAALQSRRER